MQAVSALLLPLALLFSSWLGWRVQRLLPPHHSHRDSIDAIRLVMSMLLTFAAIVLGLLTSEAKSRYDSGDANMRRYSIDLIELDQGFREYGGPAEQARALLRSYTAAAVADTWPDEAHPTGSYPSHLTAVSPGSIESNVLGSLLLHVNILVARLAPTDAMHVRLATLLQTRMASLIEQRWVLVESANAALSWPFLIVMMVWLVLVFAIFGLSSPANGLVYVVIGLCALSVSLALDTIIDFDGPLTGLIRISSASMREALMHMDQPLLPPLPGDE